MKKRLANNENHSRGVWVRVTTLSSVERWWKRKSLVDALQWANGFINNPIFLTVHIFENDTVRVRYAYHEGDTKMGILSQSNEQTRSYGSYVSPSHLAKLGTRFIITAIREDEFRGQKQDVFDIKTLDGDPIDTGRTGSEGEVIYDSVLTFKLGRTDQKGNTIESRAALVAALKSATLPYVGDYDQDGQPLGCIIKMSGNFAILTDAGGDGGSF